MKKINSILRKCKSLSRQLARSSSYSNLRSKSSRQDFWVSTHDHCDQQQDQLDEYDQKSATIFVGSAKKRYVISTKHLSHPLLEALIDKSRQKGSSGDNNNIQDHINNNNNNVLVVKCEVVLFDHLLWMLENADPVSLGSESLEELAALYVF
ncbi:hypothetical protein L484_002133 [Morus notabilis]|uniref:Uncharacterized protein n=1 Tax=Morus notabilis TaxID=981085 RepID=W9S1R7_9ROSA|nr:uncharacterized protein LOC21385713 [Morus notabilis]EXC21332.1 hypothetical protein L484_002133 [Morus notabilis]